MGRERARRDKRRDGSRDIPSMERSAHGVEDGGAFEEDGWRHDVWNTLFWLEDGCAEVGEVGAANRKDT